MGAKEQSGRTWPSIFWARGTASLYYFLHAVAGGPAVTCFPAVEGVLDVANVPADPGVPILAGGFTYWMLDFI